MEVTVADTLPSEIEWKRHLAWMGEIDFFASYDWYRNFVTTVAGDRENILFVLVADGDDGLVAALPLWRPPHAGPKFIRPVESLGNYYTCLFQPILCEDRDRAKTALRHIVDYLAQSRGQWSSLNLRPLPADAWYLPELTEGFTRNGFRPRQYVAFGNWYLDSSGMDFATYFASRRKKLRSTVRSKTNQLSANSSFEIRVIDRPEDVAAGFAAYLDVYNSSWKVTEPYPEFIPGLMQALAQRGALRLGLLFVDGKAAAAQLWFVHGNVASIFKLAYAEQFAHFSVGSLLQMHLMQHVLDMDHVSEVDFLSGDDEYKSIWMSERRERIGLEIINRRSLAGAYLNLRAYAGQLKKWWKARHA